MCVSEYKNSKGYLLQSLINPLMQSLQGLSLPNHGATPVQYIYLREDSSSATASNLPGPSRVMGQLFSWLGVKLERRINLAADRLGYGPQALRRGLSKEYKGLWRAMRDMPAKQRDGMVKKLMGYVSSGTSITQSQALELICDLILKDENLAIRDEFLDAGLYAELQNLWIYCNMAQNQYQYLARHDPDIDYLLASSRKALIFVEENEVNIVAKPFLSFETREIPGTSYPDRLAMLSPLLHAFTVLLRQLYLKETQYTPIGALAFAYCIKIRSVSLSIIHSFHIELLRTESLVTPLPTEKIELCIRADFLSFFPFIGTDRTFVRHCTFKSLTEERKLRYYSVVQGFTVDYNEAQEPDFWDDIPLPTLPDQYSNVEMELISVTKVPVGLSKLDELRFPLPTGLDRAILLDTSWDLIQTGGFVVGSFLTIWEISSES